MSKHNLLIGGELCAFGVVTGFILAPFAQEALKSVDTAMAGTYRSIDEQRPENERAVLGDDQLGGTVQAENDLGAREQSGNGAAEAVRGIRAEDRHIADVLAGHDTASQQHAADLTRRLFQKSQGEPKTAARSHSPS